MDMVQIEEQSRTSRLAGDWLTAQLALVDRDKAAAEAAIKEIEEKASIARLALTATGWSESGVHGHGARCLSATPAIGHNSGANSYVHANPLPSHGLTRNQQTKVRGVAILEVLAGSSGPHTLAAIHERMLAQGFTDEDGGTVTDSAIRSHLRRLGEQGTVDFVSKGLYKLAHDGFSQLDLERSMHQSLIEKFRAAQ